LHEIFTYAAKQHYRMANTQQPLLWNNETNE